MLGNLFSFNETETEALGSISWVGTCCFLPLVITPESIQYTKTRILVYSKVLPSVASIPANLSSLHVFNLHSKAKGVKKDLLQPWVSHIHHHHYLQGLLWVHESKSWNKSVCPLMLCCVQALPDGIKHFSAVKAPCLFVGLLHLWSSWLNRVFFDIQVC